MIMAAAIAGINQLGNAGGVIGRIVGWRGEGPCVQPVAVCLAPSV
jgi:hypothetical protein